MLKSFVARKQVAEGIQAEACLTPPRLPPEGGLHSLGPLILHGPLHSGSHFPGTTGVPAPWIRADCWRGQNIISVYEGWSIYYLQSFFTLNSCHADYRLENNMALCNDSSTFILHKSHFA